MERKAREIVYGSVHIVYRQQDDFPVGHRLF